MRIKPPKLRTVCALGILLPAPATFAQEFPALDCIVNPNQVVDISSPVPGVVEDILVERSDYVTSGQVVARLAAGVEKAGVELARARTRLDPEISSSQVNVDYDNKRMARIDELYGKKVVTRENKEEAEREARLSVWRLQQALELKEVREHELKRAEELLAQKTIKATLDGFVVQRFKSKGEYVEDQPILRIAQLDPLRVEAIVPMEFFGKIKPGMRASVHPESGAGAREASVILVDAVGDPGSGTFGVRLALPNPEFTVPAGSRCEMKFIAGSAPDPDLPVLQRPLVNQDVSAKLSIGPFPALAALEQFQASLARQEIRNSIREEAYVIDAHMVLASDPVSDQLIASLDANAITEYSVVRTPPWENRLSLGVFSNPQNADNHKRHLSDIGIATEVVPRSRPAVRFWLDVDAGDASAVEELIEAGQEDLQLVENSGNH